MNFLEKDLETIIWETDGATLNQRGLHYMEPIIKKRQLKIGNYGVCDMITFDKVPYGTPEITIYEFKKEVINVDTFLQAVKYARGVQRYLEKRKLFRDGYALVITLVGKYIDLGSFLYLPDVLTDYDSNNGFGLNLYTYEYKIDGLFFKSHYGYTLGEEGF